MGHINPMAEMNTMVGEQSEAIQLAPDLRIAEFENAMKSDSLLIRTPQQKHIQVDGFAKELLLYIQRRTETVGRSELWSEFSARGEHLNHLLVDQTIDRLVALGILNSCSGTAPLHSMQSKKSQGRGRSYFLVKIPIISSRWVAVISRLLARAFSPKIIFTAVPVLMLFQIGFWYLALKHSGAAFRTLRSNDVLTLLLGNYLGLLMHEFGHAAACFRGGEKPGNVGLGIYLLFPVFYIDVSRAWALSRKDRLCVDAAGVYVSLIFAFTASMIYLIHGGSVWALLATSYGLTVIACLNPFIKMDGYWFLSDLMGIPALMNANREMSKWLAWRCIGKHLPRPQILRLPSGLRNCYLVYYAFFALFICFVSLRLYFWYLPHVVQALPDLCRKIADTALQKDFSWSLLKLSLQFLLRSLPLLLTITYAVRFIKRIHHWFSSRSAAPEAKSWPSRPEGEVYEHSGF